MVKPTIEDIQHSDLTPLERELALASFGAEALTVAQMEESLAALESAISDAHAAGQSRDETHDDANGNASGAHPAAAPASRKSGCSRNSIWVRSNRCGSDVASWVAKVTLWGSRASMPHTQPARLPRHI